MVLTSLGKLQTVYLTFFKIQNYFFPNEHSSFESDNTTQYLNEISLLKNEIITKDAIINQKLNLLLERITQLDKILNNLAHLKNEESKYKDIAEKFNQICKNNLEFSHLCESFSKEINVEGFSASSSEKMKATQLNNTDLRHSYTKIEPLLYPTNFSSCYSEYNVTQNYSSVEVPSPLIQRVETGNLNLTKPETKAAEIPVCNNDDHNSTIPQNISFQQKSVPSIVNKPESPKTEKAMMQIIALISLPLLGFFPMKRYCKRKNEQLFNQSMLNKTELALK